MGFVDGLFEMYKLREGVAKAQAELISYSVISSYTYKFGTFRNGIGQSKKDGSFANRIQISDFAARKSKSHTGQKIRYTHKCNH